MEIINCNQRIFALVICAVYSYARSSGRRRLLAGINFVDMIADADSGIKMMKWKGIKGTL